MTLSENQKFENSSNFEKIVTIFTIIFKIQLIFADQESADYTT